MHVSRMVVLLFLLVSLALAGCVTSRTATVQSTQQAVYPAVDGRDIDALEAALANGAVFVLRLNLSRLTEFKAVLEDADGYSGQPSLYEALDDPVGAFRSILGDDDSLALEGLDPERTVFWMIELDREEYGVFYELSTLGLLPHPEEIPEYWRSTLFLPSSDASLLEAEAGPLAEFLAMEWNARVLAIEPDADFVRLEFAHVNWTYEGEPSRSTSNSEERLERTPALEAFLQYGGPVGVYSRFEDLAYHLPRISPLLRGFGNFSQHDELHRNLAAPWVSEPHRLRDPLTSEYEDLAILATVLGDESWYVDIVSTATEQGLAIQEATGAAVELAGFGDFDAQLEFSWAIDWSGLQDAASPPPWFDASDSNGMELVHWLVELYDGWSFPILAPLFLESPQAVLFLAQQTLGEMAGVGFPGAVGARLTRDEEGSVRGGLVLYFPSETFDQVALQGLLEMLEGASPQEFASNLVEREDGYEVRLAVNAPMEEIFPAGVKPQVAGGLSLRFDVAQIQFEGGTRIKLPDAVRLETGFEAQARHLRLVAGDVSPAPWAPGEWVRASQPVRLAGVSCRRELSLLYARRIEGVYELPYVEQLGHFGELLKDYRAGLDACLESEEGFEESHAIASRRLTMLEGELAEARGDVVAARLHYGSVCAKGSEAACQALERIPEEAETIRVPSTVSSLARSGCIGWLSTFITVDGSFLRTRNAIYPREDYLVMIDALAEGNTVAAHLASLDARYITAHHIGSDSTSDCVSIGAPHYQYEQEREWELRLLIRADGIDVEIEGVTLEPIESCPADGPSICNRPGELSVEALYEAALQAREAGDGQREEEYISALIERYDVRRLYTTLLELRNEYSQDVELMIRTSEVLPFALTAHIATVPRSVLQREHLESEEAFRQARHDFEAYESAAPFPWFQLEALP